MNRRGFFSAIASAVVAGIVIPCESNIVAPPPLITGVDFGILDTTAFTFHKHAFSLTYEAWGLIPKETTDEETGIHVRLFPDPAQRMDVQAVWGVPIEHITGAEFAKRYPDKSAPAPIVALPPLY